MGQLAIAGRNASIDAVNTLLNGGTLEIRTGAAGAIDSAPTGTVLATLTINVTAFAAASAGSASFNAIVDVTATAAGTATTRGATTRRRAGTHKPATDPAGEERGK